MKVSIDEKQTYCTVAELVEGEAFIRRDSHAGDLVYIYAWADDDDSIVVLLVTENGLIPRRCSAEEVIAWRIQPLEITSIAFAPSTCHNHW